LTKGREPNPDRARCHDFGGVIEAPGRSCHVQQAWGRRYWEHLAGAISPIAATIFTRCPASNGAYQLLRQQALAEGIAATGRFALVVSGVAYDEGNEGLFRIRTARGHSVDLREAWPRVFAGRARFATFTHQSWVRYVAQHSPGPHADWLTYVQARYGYPAAVG
jgi:hypothetical protein